MPTRDKIIMTYVVEDPGKPNCLSDFISMTIFEQQCLRKLEDGHNHDFEIDATLLYYSFTKNTYVDMIKQTLWLCKEDLGVDALTVNTYMGHDPKVLEDLKFVPASSPYGHYLINYSFGERIITPNEYGVIFE